MIARGEISVRDLVRAHLEVIEKENPLVNAICTLEGERAMERAGALDNLSAHRHSAGPIHGLVVGIKDTHFTRGVRTTFGSPIYRDLVPNQSHLHVELLEQAGAIVIGKTNVPEFAAGSQTTNPIFGSTRNPYDPSKTAGGSSGGSAAALATGMVSLADGSDMGGSLRNPASFCNVFGLRPTPGRVPSLPSRDPWNTLSVIGPMGRTAKDVGLMLSVIAHWSSKDPLSLKDPHVIYNPNNWISPPEKFRIAASEDLSFLVIEPSVRTLFKSTLETLSGAGLSIEAEAPDLTEAERVFRVLRGYSFAGSFETEYCESRELLNADIIWNIEEGRGLSALDIYRARKSQAELYRRMLEFFDRYDFLMLPTVQVLPFPVTQRHPSEIDGRTLESYIDWMASCYVLSVLNLPVLAVPAGFSPDGLPFGIQIAGKPGSELNLLMLGDQIDQILGATKRCPPVRE